MRSINRCYWDYLRVYAPGGSELLAADGLNRPAAEQGERGTTVFAGSFALRPGDQHVVTLRYRLPADMPAAPYRLFVRKQAGTLAPPLPVTVGRAIGRRIWRRIGRLYVTRRGDTGTRDAGTRGRGDVETRRGRAWRIFGATRIYGCIKPVWMPRCGFLS